MLHQSESVRNFIKAACVQIKSRRVHSKLGYELAEHIEDQKSAYIKQGLSEAAAEEKAIEEMGDPAMLSEQFKQVYHINLEWIPAAVMWTVAGIIAFAGLVIGVIFFVTSSTVGQPVIAFSAGTFFIVLGAMFAFLFITVWKVAADMVSSYMLVREYRRRSKKNNSKL
jgi:uncharacterized membrane protein